ncbi:unnamed protein product [Caenorhabditis angaria]|uniref:B3/B4 tRNA-binding domain-containing protein n=1 Tax=Caenorhabditis angaria TaxID=860376 RepID=A0A9P1MWY5_9PELO|nr:unnamed protein product [Caenorhabditis angaria]
MFNELPEVLEAIKSTRFEIVIKNENLEKSTESDQNPAFEQLEHLNLLSITSSKLCEISQKLSICSNLLSLVLPRNDLKELPDIFGAFLKLKFIDLSHNQLEKLPESISKLEKLESLIVANNKLGQDGFPDLSELENLHVFDGSFNLFDRVVITLTSENLGAKLHTIDLSNNRIQEIPEDLTNLRQIKELRLNSNKLGPIPTAIAHLPKLKTLDLSENPFKDTRLKKLANDKRAKVSAVIAYIAKNGPALGTRKTSENLAENQEILDENDRVSESAENRLIVRVGIDELTVKRHPSVSGIRPYLVATVFNNIDLDGEGFRKFISLQTKLHASPFCENRALTAIGTHKLDAFQLPITYMALPKDDLHIRALNKKSSVSAAELLDNLLRDAELARKRSKRNTIDPLHRYLHIVRDEPILACHVDAQGLVISLPPITNSDSTKLTTDTTRVWVEVTSKISLEACKKTMDELVLQSRLIFPELSLDQIRVQESDTLVSIYPDKHDLAGVELQRVTV